MSDRVGVVGLGGTIAMAPGPSGGIEPAVSIEALLEVLPHLEGTVELVPRQVAQVPGPHVDVPTALRALHAARDLVDDGCVGVVLTQGTDTIEEVAYLLDLWWDRPEPLVITGAMRGSTAVGADGPANLDAAVAVARAASARDRGVLVVLDDTIHAASRVTKAHTWRPSAFTSPRGEVGVVAEGRVRFLQRPGPRDDAIAAPEAVDGGPVVALALASLGADADGLRRLADGVDGLVIAGFGAGHLAADWRDVAVDLAGRISVVLGSRVGGGPVLHGTYGFPGSELDLRRHGLIGAGWLSPLQARLLLIALLAAGLAGDDLSREFAARAGD